MIVERVDLAQHAHDLELFLVQRVALELHWIAAGSSMKRALWNVRIVSACAHPVRSPAATRIARHEVRLDQAGCDAQVGFDEAPVELHRRGARSRDAEVDVRGVAGRSDSRPEPFQDPRVAHDRELRALVRPVQARRNEHRDVVFRDPASSMPSISGRRNK
jgi:hypothetical protein